MGELITSKEDLIAYLTTKRIASKHPPDFAYIKTATRAKILVDDMQGKFIHNGSVKKFKFDSVGGGVWKASIA